MIASILIFLVCAVVLTFIGMLFVNVILLATGKITREQLKENAEKYQKEKQARQEKKKKETKVKGGGFDFLGYPSPLNKWL